HNPVDWFPWGEEALAKSQKENKPILISIGYAACHWCHVMERESFEDKETAKIMNENFINIKIDREERPDLDHIYMDAVQAMTGSGGWPLNVFLTPDKKPFYGGTYFPPQRAYNRSSWKETLLNVAQAFNERRLEIESQAGNLTDHLVQSNSFGQLENKGDEFFLKENPALIFQNMMKSADREWGGFGMAPKFPQTFSIQYLLRYYHVSKDPEALNQAMLSLDKMIEGGIYDQVGGGFARYSTDAEWLIPHFEKMLYDNALLISVLSEAYQLIKKERYREVIDETMAFVNKEFLHQAGGFYSALDADSEGIEGKFYLWDKKEVEEILGSDASVFCNYYDISEKGNWEYGNILRVKKSIENFAADNNFDTIILKQKLQEGRQKLLEERGKRIRPQLDDKIILGWNALMNTACSKAFGATGNEQYLQLAIQNMQFLLSEFSIGYQNGFHHTWKNGEAKIPAFLDDYAFLIQALIHLQEITAGSEYLLKAQSITEFVIENFSESDTGFFFYTPSYQQDVFVRKKEMYDGAVPSGNAVMGYNLLRLSILFDRPVWKKRCLEMVGSVGKVITRFPTTFANWANLLIEIVEGTCEISIVGTGYSVLQKELLAWFLPNKVLMVSATGQKQYPFPFNKPQKDVTALYLCRNNTCLQPVFSVKELIALINKAPGHE
ncbi:MAG TPA: thioredoxin domain-containing protein, partial [Chitinophagaceae bacterium]|nr:thioredoxin domain-containing protein [Chitinophagaceae bacterium]